MESDWAWRLRMARELAWSLDPPSLGVAHLYLVGSAKGATAGPGSDIDLLVHFTGSSKQRRQLDRWLEDWSVRLDEMNYRRTGFHTGGLLDVHVVTDEDIRRRTSFAVMIDSAYDPAYELPLRV